MKNIKNITGKVLNTVAKVFTSLFVLSSGLVCMIYAGDDDDKPSKGGLPTGGLSSDADKKFNLIVNTIASYGFKFGLLIIFYGAIQIGLAFKNDNPDGKVQGARTAIAGLIVAAVSAGANQFIS